MSLDRAALAGYCQSYARFLEAERIIAGEGNLSKTATGSVQVNPVVWIASSALKQMLKFAVQFGLSPSSRSRISITPRDPYDPLEELLDKGLDGACN